MFCLNLLVQQHLSSGCKDRWLVGCLHSSINIFIPFKKSQLALSSMTDISLRNLISYLTIYAKMKTKLFDDDSE